MEEDIHVKATIGVEASDAVETATISMISDSISESFLNSSIHQTKNKTPTPYNSPTQSSEHTSSLKHGQVLPLGFVMSSPKPSDDSDSHTIAQMLRSF